MQLKPGLVCVAFLIAICSAGQNIKIVDAELRGGSRLIRLPSRDFSFCYRVETSSENKTKFRIYQFDSIAKLKVTMDLDLFGDYSLVAHTGNLRYTTVVARSADDNRFAFRFIDSTGASGSPVLLTLPWKTNFPYQFVASADNDAFFLAMPPASKGPNKGSFRIIAMTSQGRILWDIMMPAKGAEQISVSPVKDKLIVETSMRQVTMDILILNQSDGSKSHEHNVIKSSLVAGYTVKTPLEHIFVGRIGDPNHRGSEIAQFSSLSLADWSMRPDKRMEVSAGQKPIIWVGAAVINETTYLIGEEYYVDATSGAAAGAALAALTGVYGASFTTVRFEDVIIQPYSSSDSTLSKPHIVKIKERQFTMPGSASGLLGAQYGVQSGGNRFLNVTRGSQLMFLSGEEVVAISAETGETSVVGRFDLKGKTPPIIHASKAGLLVRESNPQDAVINFRRIPLE